MNLAAVIDDHPADHPALISRGKSTSYGELREQVARVRGGLSALGVGAADRVGVLAANNWYFVAPYLGTLGLGAVAVPLNPMSPPRELQSELATVGAKAVVVGPAGRQAMASLDRTALPDLAHVVVSGDLLSAEPMQPVARQPSDPAVLMFTSGTAGSPRAAVLTHGNLRANLDQIQAAAPEPQRPDDIVLAALPFFHIFGLNLVLNLSLSVGSTIVTVERFDPHSSLGDITSHGVTIVSGVPAMWTGWAGLPEGDVDTFRTVRLATSGVAPLPLDVRHAVRDRLGLTLVEGYGLTEASPAVTSGLGSDAPDGSVGTPIPGVRVRLVDPEGEDVLVGDPGEVWVQGPNVFGGYWNDERATRAALGDDGCLRTGDIGVVDDRGFLYLVDRSKDLIIVSGFNVFPAEVEEVIAEHPSVAGVAVVGVPHPHSGEAVKAFVVPAPGSSIEEDEIVSFCAEHLARYKCPGIVTFVDELPHGLTGKLLRRELH